MCRSKAEALSFIGANVLPKTALYADEAAAWDDLHVKLERHRIDHQEAYSLGGAKAVHTNTAEAFFSRMRRGEIGHRHHIAGPYPIRFADEAAWRETCKRAPNGTQVDRIVALAMHRKPGADFCGYQQRSRAA